MCWLIDHVPLRTTECDQCYYSDRVVVSYHNNKLIVGTVVVMVMHGFGCVYKPH